MQKNEVHTLILLFSELFHPRLTNMGENSIPSAQIEKKVLERGYGGSQYYCVSGRRRERGGDSNESQKLALFLLFTTEVRTQSTLTEGRLNPTLLQDLTQDSATPTGWRRTKRSGEGKMNALYGPGICYLRSRSFPSSPEISGDFSCEKEGMHVVGSNSLPLDY